MDVLEEYKQSLRATKLQQRLFLYSRYDGNDNMEEIQALLDDGWEVAHMTAPSQGQGYTIYVMFHLRRYVEVQDGST